MIRRISILALVAPLLAAGVVIGGSAAPSGAAQPCVRVGQTVTCTYLYNGTNGSDGTPQPFAAPVGVSTLTIEAWGAQGGGAGGGLGGYTKGTFAVAPQLVLVLVGGRPSGLAGGYNGGGTAAAGNAGLSSGGGGGSDVRTSPYAPAFRLLAAGGGGGSGSAGLVGNVEQVPGGEGNGATVPSGCVDLHLVECGAPGSAGGAAGARGLPVDSLCDPSLPASSSSAAGGAAGSGGNGGSLECLVFPPPNYTIGGGGGGGGWIGGGGGAAEGICIPDCSQVGGPGGGGSGGFDPSGTNTSSGAGVQAGNGKVVISYLAPPTVPPTPPSTVPGAPTPVSAVPVGRGSAKLIWRAPKTDGGAIITGYSVKPFLGSTALPARVFNSAVVVQVINGLQPGKKYRFEIAARNVKGTGPWSAMSGGMTAGAPGRPGKPNIVRKATGSLKASFTLPANNGAAIKSYTATCTSANGGVAKTRTARIAPVTVAGLTAGKKYVCTISATNSRGAGPRSVPSAAVTA